MPLSNRTDLEALIEKPINGLANGEALNHIGVLIDAACDTLSAAGTDRAFALLDEIRARDLAPDLTVLGSGDPGGSGSGDTLLNSPTHK